MLGKFLCRASFGMTLGFAGGAGPPAGRAGKSKILNQKFAIINQKCLEYLKCGVPGVKRLGFGV